MPSILTVEEIAKVKKGLHAGKGKGNRRYPRLTHRKRVLMRQALRIAQTEQLRASKGLWRSVPYSKRRKYEDISRRLNWYRKKPNLTADQRERVELYKMFKNVGKRLLIDKYGAK